MGWKVSVQQSAAVRRDRGRTEIGLEWLFGGDPSFHGSLKPRPSTNVGWDGNFGESFGIPTTVPQGNLGLGMALGLPTQGCEFGACGAGPTGFQAGVMAAPALGPLAACIAAEPCGTILLGVATAGVLGYDIYLMGSKQSNEWTDKAKQFAPQDPCTWLQVQKGLAQNADSATQKKIVQAQKFLGCRNVNKRNQ